MSNKKAPSETNNLDLDLEFPDMTGNHTWEKISLEDIPRIIELSEQYLPFLNSRPGREEERWKEKIQVPFEL